MSCTADHSAVARRCSTYAVLFTLLSTIGAAQQKSADVNTKPPLVIAEQGSFFVGGHLEHSTAVSGTQGGVLSTGNEDDIMVGQMYVQYQIPQGHPGRTAVVMVHGCCLSGKTWETTPDGRMGWNEYFLRKGRPVYLPDQSSRARSGFDPTVINQVKLGILPSSSIPSIFTPGRKLAWKLFRFGPEYPTTFSDEQFPVGAIDEFAKQVIPDFNETLPNPNPTWANLAALAVRIKGAVLMGHSQSGFFPEQAALTDPSGVRGLISIEGQCETTLSQPQLATLAKIPILVIFGDHVSDVPTLPVWPGLLAGCEQFVQQVNNAGGNATMLNLPKAGHFGNSHMLMQDLNNLKVADLVLEWIDKRVGR